MFIIVDFKVERNCLYQNAYPKLKKICSEKGLEFQVLDLRWGVTDDVINDHQVSQLCLDEVVNCQKLSCGPNFVVRARSQDIKKFIMLLSLIFNN